MISAVLFDFGQTLVDSSQGFRAAEKTAETRIFENLGLASWSEFLSDYRTFRQDFHAVSIFSRRALWQAVFEHYSCTPKPGLLSELEWAYWEEVSARTRLFPEALSVLERLSERHRLAMITNTQGQSASHRHRLARFSDLESYFEVIIVAGEEGIPTKPDPEPFLLCLERLSLDPAETVYVGDDWRIDICGAKAIGIRPIWLQHHSTRRKWPQVAPDVPVIFNLEELLDLDALWNDDH